MRKQLCRLWWRQGNVSCRRGASNGARPATQMDMLPLVPHATVPHTAVHGNVLVVGGSSRLAATACRRHRHCFRLQLPPAQAALPVCLSGKSLDVDRDFRAFSPKSGVSRANAPITQVILPPLFPLKTRGWMQSDWRAQSVDVNGAGRARTVRQTD